MPSAYARFALLLCTAAALPQGQLPALDLLIAGGRVLDGAGNPWVTQDIGISGDTIVFLGDARAAGLHARETLDVAAAL